MEVKIEEIEKHSRMHNIVITCMEIQNGADTVSGGTIENLDEQIQYKKINKIKANTVELELDSYENKIDDNEKKGSTEKLVK